MNCDQCLAQCKGACCGPVPFPEKLYRQVRALAATEPETELRDSEGRVYAVNASGSCIFQRLDYSCAIYDRRPNVCRLFGNEAHPMLVCPWQDKDGRVRFKAERKRIQRSQKKALEGRLAALRQSVKGSEPGAGQRAVGRW